MTRARVAPRRSPRLAAYLRVTCVVVWAWGATGCLSSNDSPIPPVVLPDVDAAPFDAALPSVDAYAPVDANAPIDAGTDAPAPDDAAPPPVDAGPIDAGPQSQVGLVGGGTSSRSAHYALVGSTSPATSPPLHSANYGLTGGMAATAQKH